MQSTQACPGHLLCVGIIQLKLQILSSQGPWFQVKFCSPGPSSKQGAQAPASRQTTEGLIYSPGGEGPLSSGSDIDQWESSTLWEGFLASRTNVELFKEENRLWVCKYINFFPSLFFLPCLFLFSLLPLIFLPEKGSLDPSLWEQKGCLGPSGSFIQGWEKCSDLLLSSLRKWGRAEVLDTASLKPEFGIVLMSLQQQEWCCLPTQQVLIRP